jgi:glyoxylate reductase
MSHQKKPLVIVTRKLPDVIETRMMELFDVQLNLDDTPMNEEQMIAALKEADVLVPTVTDHIGPEVLSKAGPNLRLIANYGTGVDHVDLAQVERQGLVLTNTPDVLTEDTADMTMALILAVPRRLSEGERILRADQWQGWAPTNLLGHRVNGKRLGIIGMGRIGQAVARRAMGFSMSVHYHNRRRVPEDVEDKLAATYWDSLDQMLARVDIVCVNCPHTPATYHLLSSRRLQLLRPDAYLINTARGEVVDEKALVEALKNGDIAGAGLDVYENEPAVNPAFLSMENVVLLPHMGSATQEGRIAMGERVLINIKTFVDGNKPPDRVLGEAF